MKPRRNRAPPGLEKKFLLAGGDGVERLFGIGGLSGEIGTESFLLDGQQLGIFRIVPDVARAARFQHVLVGPEPRLKILEACLLQDGFLARIPPRAGQTRPASPAGTTIS